MGSLFFLISTINTSFLRDSQCMPNCSQFYSSSGKTSQQIFGRNPMPCRARQLGKKEEINTEDNQKSWSIAVLFFSVLIEGIKFYFINFSLALPKSRCSLEGWCRAAPGSSVHRVELTAGCD